MQKTGFTVKLTCCALLAVLATLLSVPSDSADLSALRDSSRTSTMQPSQTDDPLLDFVKLLFVKR